MFIVAFGFTVFAYRGVTVKDSIAAYFAKFIICQWCIDFPWGPRAVRISAG